MKMSCLPQVKPSKNVQSNAGLFNISYASGLNSMQQPFLRPDPMTASRLADTQNLLSMMAHSQETRRNIMLHNQLLKQQQQPALMDLISLQQQQQQQRSQLSNMFQPSSQAHILQRMNSPMIVPSQQQILQLELERLTELRSAALRANTLNSPSDMSSLLSTPKAALHDKIARVELEIAALREARLKQISQERAIVRKDNLPSGYPKSFGSKSAVRSYIRRASAA